MQAAAFILLAIMAGIAALIAHFIGRKRQIGFGWSFFFCIVFSPIIGFIIVMLSRKYYDENPKPSIGKKIWGWLLIIIGTLSFLGRMVMIANPVIQQQTGTNINQLVFAVGLFGLGCYLIQLGNGKNFNSQALTKTGI